MNREELKALGLTDEQIDKVMASHGKVINDTKEKLNTVRTERDDLKEQLTSRDQQLESLSKQVKDNEELTAEINRLKEDNKNATQELQQKLERQAFDFSLEKALTDAKVRNPKAVKALLDLESIKLDGEKLLGLDDQLTSIKESDSYLFEVEQNNDPKPNFTTGQHSKGAGITTEDFNKMTYQERLKLKQENPDQYNTMVRK